MEEGALVGGEKIAISVKIKSRIISFLYIVTGIIAFVLTFPLLAVTSQLLFKAVSDPFGLYEIIINSLNNNRIFPQEQLAWIYILFIMLFLASFFTLKKKNKIIAITVSILLAAFWTAIFIIILGPFHIILQ